MIASIINATTLRNQCSCAFLSLARLFSSLSALCQEDEEEEDDDDDDAGGGCGGGLGEGFCTTAVPQLGQYRPPVGTSDPQLTQYGIFVEAPTPLSCYSCIFL